MNAPVKPPIVNVHEAKTHLSRLLDRVQAGEEIILARAGKPCAKLVPLPVEELPKRQPGRFRHMLGTFDPDLWFESLPDHEIDAWEGRYSAIV